MYGLGCADVPRGRATLHTDVLLKCSKKVDTQKGGKGIGYVFLAPRWRQPSK